MSVCLGIALCWPCLKISCSVPSGNIFCANRVKTHSTQFHKHFKTLETQISQAFENRITRSQFAEIPEGKSGKCKSL